MSESDDRMRGVPPSLARKFKQKADMDELDREKARKEGLRLDQVARNKVTKDWYGDGKGGPKTLKMDGPKPPNGSRAKEYRDYEAAVKSERNLMAKEEFNRVKSIGETKFKVDQKVKER